ncbi:hypothetical protein M9Y10_005340 [Tritrichomonas musculus]|uniref:P-type phospholipid transporter n=1 Tax=Tritrichomonas musculus TaxID=1915356 RepID=A0ABR2JN28_9EUKA
MFKNRSFRVNTNRKSKFSKNKINNRKYNIGTFIFQTIFSRFTNIYFFFVAITQCFKEITPVDSVTTWIPICIIFVVTMVRELIDEFKRYLEDKKINNREYKIIRADKEQKIKFKDIRVGDIIILSENDPAPADLFLIKIDGAFHTCSISTAYLDGDTYFKDVFPLDNTKNLSYDQILHLKGFVTCNKPDPDIYKLSGDFKIQHDNSNSDEIDDSILTNKNLIQFGTIINNDHDVYGIVCYTGRDTKLAMNTKKTPVKWTKLERFIDAISISIFSLQLLLTCSFGTLANWFTQKEVKNHYYLRFDRYFDATNNQLNTWQSWLFLYLRFLMMTSSLIPISLKLTIDISKFIYDIWISHDLHLTSKEIKTSIHNPYLSNIINSTTISMHNINLNSSNIHNINIFNNDSSNNNIANNNSSANTFNNSSNNSNINNISDNNNNNINNDGTINTSNTNFNTSNTSINTSNSSLNFGNNIPLNGSYTFDAHVDVIKPSVNNSSVIEDLGAIEYIFCDKTGTLTENSMTFKKLMIDGQIYGHSLDADSIIDDEKFKEAILMKDEKVMLAVYCLALCHSSRIKSLKMALKNTPEDRAFIEGLFDLGFFINFEENFITIESDQFHIEKQQFELLKVQPFSFEIKRMCVIVKNHTNGKIYLLAQGSPDSINEITMNTKTNSTNSYGSFNNFSSYGIHVNQLASLGLRIIGLACKELDESEINNDIRILEEESHLIGLAALENKLQEGVTETIETLRKAGIKLWMLTGDSFYTSCNVSYSSHLVGNDGPFILLSNDKERLGLSTQNNQEQSSQGRPSRFSFRSNSNSDLNLSPSAKKSHFKGRSNLKTIEFESMNASSNIYNNENSDFYFDDIENPNLLDMKYVLDQIESYIDGQIMQTSGVFYLGVDTCYKQLLSDEHREQFTRIAMKAKSVVCSRVSPNDKAEIVKCIKSKNRITLAIGDGGNDIPMLSIADVGVGIIGKEGRQAAAASDFCFSKFRFLVRLLLIHGRYAMHRTSTLAQLCFYKSAVFFFIQFFYNLHNGYSVASYFSDINMISYNTLFTVLPVIFYIQDKDLCESSVLLHPFVYSDSQHSIFCNRRTIFWWYMRALFQSIVLYFMSWSIFGKTYSSFIDGSSATLDEMQQVTFSAMIIIVIITVASESHHATILNLMFTWGDWLLYVTFSLLINTSYESYITRDFYLVMYRVISNPFDWVAILSMVSVALFVPFIITSFRIMFFPSRTEAIHDHELKKQAAFEPEYLVADSKGINDAVFLDEKYHPKTSWDKTHSVLLPIGLFCGCQKL